MSVRMAPEAHRAPSAPSAFDGNRYWSDFVKRILTVAVLTLVPAAVQAQSSLPVSFEARGAFAVPTGDWNDEDTFENGFGFGGAVKLMATSSIGIYAGYDWFRFGVDDSAVGEDEVDVDADATDAGFRAGVELTLPLAGSTGIVPFIQAGGVYNTITIGASSGGASLDFESDAALGYEVAGGIEFDAGPVGLRPSAFYRSHPAEFDALAPLGATEEDISYFGVVIAAVFGR